MEFLQWLLRRFIEMNSIDVKETTVEQLLDNLGEGLTPIGGG